MKGIQGERCKVYLMEDFFLQVNKFDRSTAQADFLDIRNIKNIKKMWGKKVSMNVQQTTLISKNVRELLEKVVDDDQLTFIHLSFAELLSLSVLLSNVLQLLFFLYNNVARELTSIRVFN